VGAPQEVEDFDCCYNQLTSLVGAPQEVKEDFDCSHNQLTSLEGAPQEVGGNFYCHNNKLTSLEGAPQEVGGWFSCSYNQLTSLVGAPQEVGLGFYCSDNQLTSLEGKPQKLGWELNGVPINLMRIYEIMDQEKVPYIIALAKVIEKTKNKLEKEYLYKVSLSAGYSREAIEAALIMKRFI